MEQDRQTLYEQYDQDNLNPEGGTFDFDDYQPEANSQQNSQQNTLGNGYSMEPSNGYDHQGYTDYSQEADVKIVRKESLQEVPFVINSLSNVFQQHEFGNINDQGLCTLIPLETQLHITYTWHIPRAELLEGEKMVSLPFGPREWSWQIM
jgi:hypothetical protein